MMEVTIQALYDLEQTEARPLLEAYTYPWEALGEIGAFIVTLGSQLSGEDYEKRGEDVWIAKSAVVAPTAYIQGPCIIGKNTEVRHCAFIRGNALVGNDCVVGNSTELKNVILFNCVQVPHYNYVGDSILGYKSHMGAGSITSNVKADKLPVVIKGEGICMETNRKKVGAMLGDYAEIGCNSVLNPGTVIGRHTNVYPTTMVRGAIPPYSILKNTGECISKKDQ